MDLGLAGKRALVTGGSRGIGRAVVELLTQEGCSVAFCARDPQGVEAAAAELRAGGADIVAPAGVDVGDAEAYTAWLSRAIEELGGLDILICNATGYSKPGEDGWRLVFEIDMLGLVRAFEVARPALVTSGEGSVVAVSSAAALDIFLPGPSAYGGMKAAMIHHAKALARQNGADGIRVNTVAPGVIDFEGGVWRGRRESGDPNYDKFAGMSPFGRMGDNYEVARAIVFLASPAASWITGSNLLIDGGMSTHVDF